MRATIVRDYHNINEALKPRVDQITTVDDK